MKLIVKPTSCLEGRIVPPTSKSYSIRAFIISSLGGTSRIINPSLGDDVRVSINICKQSGAKVKRLKKNIWYVKRVRKINFPKLINVGESGTSLRFLLSLASLSPRHITVKAEGTLKSRPNKTLISVLRKMGANIKGSGHRETTPIFVDKGKIRAGRINIDGTLSSQFISSLLIALPLLKSDSTVNITGDYVVSSPYIDMTIAVLNRAGIKIGKKSIRQYKISGNQRFKGLGNFYIPVDYGLSAFLMAAACLNNSKVVLQATRDNLVQADKKIIEFLKKMGVKFKLSKNKITIKGPVRLRGGDFDCKDCPDLVPVLGILALFANRKTRLHGIGHLRIKESDRISDFRAELMKVGARVEESRDELVIFPVKEFKRNCIINPHNDHRLAMAFAILGTKIGITINNIECINKSYPKFLSDLRQLGASVKIK